MNELTQATAAIEQGAAEFNANVEKIMAKMYQSNVALLSDNVSPLTLIMALTMSAADLVTALAVKMENESIIEMMLGDVMKDMSERAQAGYRLYLEIREQQEAAKRIA